jgi:hypothetical protein
MEFGGKGSAQDFTEAHGLTLGGGRLAEYSDDEWQSVLEMVRFL